MYLRDEEGLWTRKFRGGGSEGSHEEEEAAGPRDKPVQVWRCLRERAV